MRIGTSIAKAKALAPNLIIGDRDPAAETEDLTKLALRALEHIYPVVMGENAGAKIPHRSGLMIRLLAGAKLHQC